MTTDLEDFLEWCRTREIRFDGFELRSAGEGAGNGIFATRQFRTEEKLIELPESVMITAGSVANQTKYADYLKKFGRPLPAFDILTLFFCIEDASYSEWGPYIRMLPKEFDTPAYKQLDIDPSDLPLSIRDFYITQLEDLKAIFANIQSIDSSITYKKFLWAWHVVNTRCIFVENKSHPLVDTTSQPDTLSVIPFVDMLNHDPSAQGLALYDKLSNSYVVKANKCVLEGTQLYVCYGPHDNPRLWMEYGFTMSENPFTKVALKQDLFIALAKQVGIPLTDQHENALHEANMPCTLYMSDEFPSWALKTNMKLATMGAIEISMWQDYIYSNEDDDSDAEDALVDKLKRLFEELRISLVKKREKASEIVKWMWDDQLQLINTSIQ